MIPVDELNNMVWASLAPSKIHGVGVHAIRDIKKGTRITNYNLNELTSARPFLFDEKMFGNLYPEIQNLILDRTLFYDSPTLIFYSPNAEVCLQSFMNHSDTPNSDGFVALQDIKQGEEITEDYRRVKEPHLLSKKHYRSLGI